jgi:hypothetical protein
MKILWHFWLIDCLGYFFQSLGEFFSESSGHPGQSSHAILAEPFVVNAHHH